MGGGGGGGVEEGEGQGYGGGGEEEDEEVDGEGEDDAFSVGEAEGFEGYRSVGPCVGMGMGMGMGIGIYMVLRVYHILSFLPTGGQGQQSVVELHRLHLELPPHRRSGQQRTGVVYRTLLVLHLYPTTGMYVTSFIPRSNDTKRRHNIALHKHTI